jgi:hypothetical protein
VVAVSLKKKKTVVINPVKKNIENKVKQNAVKVDGELKNDLVASVKLGVEFTLRAGKKMLRVKLRE